MMVTLFDQAHVTEIHEYNIRQEGIEIGQKRGVLNTLRSLMETTGWPVDRVLTAANIPEEDRPAYRKMLLS